MRYLVGMAIFIFGLPIVLLAEDAQIGDFPRLTVKTVSFKTALALSREDLLSTLPLQPGNKLEQGDLEESLRRLEMRGIFDKVSFQVTAKGEEAEIEFVLEPAPMVGEVLFEGNRVFSSDELRRVVRLASGRRFVHLEAQKARLRVEELYREKGYLKPEVSFEVVDAGLSPWVNVYFKVLERQSAVIKKVIIEGEVPPKVRTRLNRVRKEVRGELASEDIMRELRKALLLSFRSEGYMRASVQLKQREYDEQSSGVKLIYRVVHREPVSILFRGNKAYLVSELLSLLGMDDRLLPFPKNFVSKFCRQIRDLYEQNGYFYASVEGRELEMSEGRRMYEIEILEGPKVSLEAIRFSGNSAFGDDELLSLMGTKTAESRLVRRWFPGFLSKAQVASDLEAIEEYYYVRGYRGTKADIDLTYDRKKAAMTLLVKIEEGELKRVSSVVESGDGDKPSGILPSIKVGDPFDEQAVEAERLRLAGELLDLGYPLAAVDATLDEDLGSIEFNIETGPSVYIGSVWIRGNIYTHDAVIRRELEISSGDKWREQDLRRAESNLLHLGIFNSVSLSPLDGVLDSSVEDIVVEVAERQTGSFDVGVSYHTEDGINVSGEIAQRNFLGSGDSLVLATDAYFKSGDRILDAGGARAIFGTPHVLGVGSQLFVEGFAQSAVKYINEFSYDRVGGRVALEKDLGEDLNARAGLSAYSEHVFDADPDIVIGEDDQGSSFYTIASLELDFDRRDSIYNARDGYRSLLGLELGDQVLGSDVDFLGLTLQQTLLFELHPRVVLAENLRMNMLAPFGDTELIPLSERIFLGGRSSLRGFRRNSIGPTGPSGDVLGGDRSFVSNTELRIDIWGDLGGVFFVDVGQVWLDESGELSASDIGNEDVRVSPGLGFRYRTPIGPISIDYGVVVNQKKGESPGRLHFGVGGSF